MSDIITLSHNIEEFRSLTPDEFNGMNAEGDNPFDWAPAINRAQASVLSHDLNPSAPWRMYKTPVKLKLLVGASQIVYQVHSEIQTFGIEICGLRSDVELYFINGTNGFIVNFPLTKNKLGTHDSQYGGALILRDLIIRGKNAAGTTGVKIHYAFEAYSVEVIDFGRHGFHVDADVRRSKVSNANRWYLFRCRGIRNGHNPGLNEDGSRHEPGAGLRCDGGDSNIGYNEQWAGNYNAGFSIDDSSFLGNTHISPHTAAGGHIVEQWEVDAGFRTYDIPVGEFLSLGYRSDGRNPRTLFLNPYIEQYGVFDAPPPALVVLGIGGRFTPQTHVISFGKFLGDGWEHDSADKRGITYKTIINNEGNFLSFQSSADDSKPIRLKFIPLPAPGEKADTHAGFYRLDWANLNSAAFYLMTSTKSFAPDGRKLATGKMVFQDHYVSRLMLPVSYATSAPKVGDWPVGSVVHNTSPTPGGWMGWTVTKHQTINDVIVPVWKGFGKIED